MTAPAIAIDHVALRVDDLDAAIGFYTRFLGMTVERRRDDIGLVQLRAGSALVDLVANKPGAEPPIAEGEATVRAQNLDHLCLRLVNFRPEEFALHAAAHGIAISPVQMRYGAEGNGETIYLRDPSGNGLEVRG